MKDSLFWQLRCSDSEHPSVIVGTIHLSVPEALIHWPKIQEYLAEYEDIFTESSLSDRDQAFVSNYVFFKEPDTYLEYITPNRWDKMRKTFLKYYEIDIGHMRNMRPTFILSAIYQKLMPGTGPSLDKRIWDYALSNDKNIRGLETIYEQIEILNNLSLRNQYRQLVRISKKISGTHKQFSKILMAYQNQDLYKLFQLTKRTLGPDKKLLLEDRNLILVDRMILQHNTTPSFFSFGAGHLVGKHGVLAMLKRKKMIINAI